jgi:hypothetical protein
MLFRYLGHQIRNTTIQSVKNVEKIVVHFRFNSSVILKNKNNLKCILIKRQLNSTIFKFL